MGQEAREEAEEAVGRIPDQSYSLLVCKYPLEIHKTRDQYREYHREE